MPLGLRPFCPRVPRVTGVNLPCGHELCTPRTCGLRALERLAFAAKHSSKADIGSGAATRSYLWVLLCNPFTTFRGTARLSEDYSTYSVYRMNGAAIASVLFHASPEAVQEIKQGIYLYYGDAASFHDDDDSPKILGEGHLLL